MTSPCLKSMPASLQSIFHTRYASLEWLARKKRSHCFSRRYIDRSTTRSCLMNKPVVLITGGLTGIGRAAAVAFSKRGAKVVVAGRRDEAGKAAVKELRSFGSEAEFVNADVRKEDEVRALVDKTIARFGRLDVAAWGGGFPIKVDGEVVGSIGVSGAPTVQNDIDYARAALALVPDADSRGAHFGLS